MALGQIIVAIFKVKFYSFSVFVGIGLARG